MQSAVCRVLGSSLLSTLPLSLPAQASPALRTPATRRCSSPAAPQVRRNQASELQIGDIVERHLQVNARARPAGARGYAPAIGRMQRGARA